MAALEVQNLLRFLTKDAKLPLADALSKVNDLRKLHANNPENIAKADESVLKTIFTDEKILKQVLTAAKRVSNPKKRLATENSSSSKRIKQDDPVDEESALVLPTTQLSVNDLEKFSIETNRAPLFLAFTLIILKYTHPEQPLSSQLSLAQAVVSAGAQMKAKSIGIISGPTAEEDGWSKGQPKLKIMGREIAVMRRQIFNADNQDDPKTISHDLFWGIDLEALRKSNGPLIAGKNRGQPGPPIHTAQSARNYLLKSMNIKDDLSPVKVKKLSGAEMMSRKEEAASMILNAIDIVCKSWVETLTVDELDRRAQSWYMLVRPEVAQGQSGWGQRGVVELKDILKLRRDS